MIRVSTFDYDQSYSPSAPFLPITIDGNRPGYNTATVLAFVDSGADGTMLPIDLLEQVGARYADPIWLRGTAGGRKRVDTYSVTIHVETERAYGIYAVATPEGSEPLIGRDVLNQLVVTLNGLAEVTELQLTK